MKRKEMLISSGILAASFFTGEKKLFASALQSISTDSSLDVFNVAEISKRYKNYTLDKIIEFIVYEIETKSYPNENGGGGVIYFPPGIWEIGKTIKLPARTLLLGMGGFFHQQGIYKSGFDKKQHTVIKLKSGSNCNIIEPKGKEFSGIQIKGIILDGNKSKQKGKHNGIHLSDISGENDLEGVRSNLSLRDVFVYNCSGNGIYAGKNQNEFRLENVLSSRNNGNGFLFRGTDILLSNVWAGDNGKNGIHINGGGAVSSVNCDSWGNKLNGLLLDSYTQNNTFTRLQCNLNARNGVQIKGGINSTVFLGSVFKQNSKILGGSFSKKYANVKLQSENKANPQGIKFIGCHFGEGNGKQKSTTFAIEDVTSKTFPNSLIGCSFAENEFTKGIVNRKVFKNYLIDNCTKGPFGGEQVFFNKPNDYIEVKKNYQIKVTDKIVAVNAAENITLTLPSVNDVPVGTEIRIVKYQQSNYVLKPQPDEYLQNKKNNSLTIKDAAWKSAVVIQANNKWILANL